MTALHWDATQRRLLLTGRDTDPETIATVRAAHRAIRPWRDRGAHFAYQPGDEVLAWARARRLTPTIAAADGKSVAVDWPTFDVIVRGQRHVETGEVGL